MSIWTTLDAAGINISRTVRLDTHDQGPEYRTNNPDGTWVAFGPQYADGALAGWTFAAYDDFGGVITTGGAPTLAEILPDLARWTR